ncbi:unnamed protein product [Rangifer tarandus platyrhynchus]|uniref:Uncharacterized protein n=1 Tax=Rangifer tarandus platyrhynchus TaxID=3082113 RepID=A0AC60A6N8_RANTA
MGTCQTNTPASLASAAGGPPRPRRACGGAPGRPDAIKSMSAPPPDARSAEVPAERPQNAGPRGPSKYSRAEPPAAPFRWRDGLQPFFRPPPPSKEKCVAVFCNSSRTVPGETARRKSQIQVHNKRPPQGLQAYAAEGMNVGTETAGGLFPYLL